MALCKNIIVPLDGSERSGQALPAAGLMARAAEGALTLTRAFAPVPDWQTDWEHGRYRGAMSAAEHDRVTAFLVGEKQRLEGMGVNRPIGIAAREGNADEVIIDLARRDPEALIVMATHGRGGFSRMMMGSVTSRVVRAVLNPTLIVRGNEPEGQMAPQALDNIIVPLDGSTFAEDALPYAAELARVFGSRITLLRSTHNTDYFRARTGWGRLDGEAGFHFGGPVEMAASMAEISREYLWRRAEDLRVRRGVGEVRVVNSLENPADAAIGLAQRLDNVLTVMTTHGRRGVGRALLGSVADQVVRGSPAPTLLVRGPMRAAAGTGELRERVAAGV